MYVTVSRLQDTTRFQNSFYSAARSCFERQVVLCTLQPAFWQSGEQYRMSSDLEHPEHWKIPNFLPQKEQGINVVFFVSWASHICMTSMHLSMVASPFSIKTFAMILNPFKVQTGSPSSSLDSACKAWHSFLVKRLRCAILAFQDYKF